MAQYKVPQDVEADDKLLGPFTFRQFVYLLIAAALIALAVGLFQIYPLLAIIPVPIIILLLAISLPLKKDQPMETYLAALVSYYLKPRKRTWTSGQPESTITITAPKVQEKVRTRDISGEEATHRLSFLANIVDTEGRAIGSIGASPMRDDLAAEADAVADIFEDSSQYRNIDAALEKDKSSRHAEVMENMRKAIAANEAPLQPQQAPTISRHYNTVAPQAYNPARDAAPSVPTAPGQPAPVQQPAPNPALETPNYNSSVVVLPDPSMLRKEEPKAAVSIKNIAPKPQKQDIINLASNQDFTVSTIAQEAKRLKGKGDGEVFISLH
ncbi:PrgI family protein [Candidatus Saccharibacteria bacterium]|nr:PrgI family protein [Candidatus Saccharibacteria bacterium]